MSVKILAMAAAISVLPTAAGAQDFDDRAANNPLVVWQGNLFLIAANATCVAGGQEVGSYGLTVFRPRLDPAEPTSGFLLHYARGSALYRRTGGAGTDKMNGAGTYSTSAFSTRATSRSWTGTYNFTLSPANPGINTPVITLNGSITNYEGVTGCVATVRGAFVRRP